MTTISHDWPLQADRNTVYHSLANVGATACNLCRGHPDHFRIIATRDRYGLPAQTVQCELCGLVFIDPRMSADDYAEFYRSGNYRRLVDQLMGEPRSEKLEECQLVYAQSVADFIAPIFANGKLKTLLDIGGSTGVVAAHLSERFGLTATVLDQAVPDLDRARARGLECVEGDVGAMWERCCLDTVDIRRSPTRTWDCIGLFQTVDHLLDIAETLRMVRDLLSPGGVLLVDIVEFRWALTHFGLEGSLKVDHPFSLSGNTILAFLFKAGFGLLAPPAPSLGGRKILYVCYDSVREITGLCSKGTVNTKASLGFSSRTSRDEAAHKETR